MRDRERGWAIAELSIHVHPPTRPPFPPLSGGAVDETHDGVSSEAGLRWECAASMAERTVRWWQPVSATGPEDGGV